MNILRSQSVRAQKRYIQRILFVVLKRENPKALFRMYNPRSKNVNTPERKTRWIFFVLKAWEPKSAIYNVLFGVLKRENPKGLIRMYIPRSKNVNAPKGKTWWIFFVLVNHCFTTRTSCTSCTGRGLVYTPLVSLMIYSSPTERLVNHCFTTLTSRTGRGLECTP